MKKTIRREDVGLQDQVVILRELLREVRDLLTAKTLPAKDKQEAVRKIDAVLKN